PALGHADVAVVARRGVAVRTRAGAADAGAVRGVHTRRCVRLPADAAVPALGRARVLACRPPGAARARRSRPAAGSAPVVAQPPLAALDGAGGPAPRRADHR